MDDCFFLTRLRPAVCTVPPGSLLFRYRYSIHCLLPVLMPFIWPRLVQKISRSCSFQLNPLAHFQETVSRVGSGRNGHTPTDPSKVPAETFAALPSDFTRLICALWLGRSEEPPSPHPSIQCARCFFHLISLDIGRFLLLVIIKIIWVRLKTVRMHPRFPFCGFSWVIILHAAIKKHQLIPKH